MFRKCDTHYPTDVVPSVQVCLGMLFMVHLVCHMSVWKCDAQFVWFPLFRYVGLCCVQGHVSLIGACRNLSHLRALSMVSQDSQAWYHYQLSGSPQCFKLLIVNLNRPFLVCLPHLYIMEKSRQNDLCSICDEIWQAAAASKVSSSIAASPGSFPITLAPSYN